MNYFSHLTFLGSRSNSRDHSGKHSLASHSKQSTFREPIISKHQSSRVETDDLEDFYVNDNGFNNKQINKIIKESRLEEEALIEDSYYPDSIEVSRN